MRITFLGTGTSQGVPVIACDCPVCTSSNKKDKRLRTSVLIEHEGKIIVIDTGPDFRNQMLRAKVKYLDAVLFTHEHKDHVAGLDDIRAFNFRQHAAIDLYGNKGSCEAIRREFYYAFEKEKYPGGPLIKLHELNKESFTVAGIPILPIEVIHGKLPVLGFRIKDFVYITDAKTILKVEKNKLKKCKILVINALQKDSHISHFNLQEAIKFAKDIGAEKTYFTHISHTMGKHDDVSQELPKGIELAYDGLIIKV